MSNTSRLSKPDDDIGQLLKQKEEENLALKKLLAELEKAEEKKNSEQKPKKK